MKCPHCDYQHGLDEESQKNIEGLEGGFFVSNDITMERYVSGSKGNWETSIIMGCPKCFKLFMRH